MTLRELVLLMDADEKIMVRRIGETEMLETNPDEIVNEHEALQTATVSRFWVSYALYNAIVIVIE